MQDYQFKRIASWLGWREVKPFGLSKIWVGPDKQIHGRVDTKMELTDAEATEVLNTLTRKRYPWHLDTLAANYGACLAIMVGRETVQDWITATGDTIPSAIENTLLLLIARENSQ